MPLARDVPFVGARGLRAATLKHAHHEFDNDRFVKVSYEHLGAGMSKVLIQSGRRSDQG
ncbi:MAG: molybdopterin-guanine dinucleotide biosynthesis protein MobB [Parafilimonas terrae]|nr:molybdopterin-guanine dinucleotide biosynthesis protein MobB [Parafilimonas terrae]MBY0253075.1 molybdopterin-guanine dinucleotide biosynthesis protein MobB [Methylobacterium organophilum]